MYLLKIVFVFLIGLVASTHGLQPTNYDLSRNQLNGPPIGGAAGYGQYYPGQYPGQYPYPGGQQYPGYPGQYPGNYHPPGPPGAHPGCPLCDSSVYSYCSKKQLHDSCCCDGGGGFLSFGCRKSDCNFLYANSCQEYNLISNCCCVDLQKSAAPAVAATVA